MSSNNNNESGSPRSDVAVTTTTMTTTRRRRIGRPPVEPMSADEERVYHRARATAHRRLRLELAEKTLQVYELTARLAEFEPMQMELDAAKDRILKLEELVHKMHKRESAIHATLTEALRCDPSMTDSFVDYPC
jgi:hypothetical protein